jgi:hypothetical protein
MFSSHVLAASNLLHTFGDLHDAISQNPGWHLLGGTIGLSTTLVSVSNSSDVASTASIHGDRLNGLYNLQKSKGSQRLARDSIGWYENASVPAILVGTQCQGSAGFEVSSWQTVATENATMDVRIGAYSNDSAFRGARCDVTIQQCLFGESHPCTSRPSLDKFQLWNSGKSRRFRIRIDPVVSMNLAPGSYLHPQRMPTFSRPQVLGSMISSLTSRTCRLTKRSSTSPLSRFGWLTASRR